MNASFRTAFWAMCLGLTVPMVLFIGVELMSPGSTSRKTAVAAADSNESLQSRLQTPAAKPVTRRPRTAGLDPRAGTTPASGAAQSKMTTSPAQETFPGGATGPAQSGLESAEPQVVLGPELEPEQATSDPEPGSLTRIRATRNTGRIIGFQPSSPTPVRRCESFQTSNPCRQAAVGRALRSKSVWPAFKSTSIRSAAHLRPMCRETTSSENRPSIPSNRSANCSSSFKRLASAIVRPRNSKNRALANRRTRVTTRPTP